MSVNHYFQSGKSIGDSNEQNLLEDIIIESIQINGFDLLYLPRTIGKFDKLFLEDTLSKFKKGYTVEAYLESITGFEGTDMLAKFGLQFNDSGTFVIAKRRWIDAVARSDEVLLPNRPTEGDIIYFSPTRSMFEIKEVNAFDPFYQLGKLYVYKLKVELFQYSSESIETGNEELDTIRFPFGNLAAESYPIFGENGIDIIADEDGVPVTSDDYELDNVDAQSDNNFIQTANDPILFNVSNPFGEIID